MSATPSQASLNIHEVAVLSGHSDEVWNLEWSHDGSRLATTSKDKTVAIWNTDSGPPESYITSLRGHEFAVSQAAWSPDDNLLLTASDNCIKIWDTQVQAESCMKRLEEHTDSVTRVFWLPDGTGFISGGLDRKLILWSAIGEIKDSWMCSLYITDLVLNPEGTRLFAHGRGSVIMNVKPAILSYDLETKNEETLLRFETAEDCTGLELSQDSRYLLLNCYIMPGEPIQPFAEIVLLDTLSKEVVRRFTGHIQTNVIIRCCFVGTNEQFIASGSQDGNVYVWDRNSGALLNVLGAHGTQCVSAVACNPANKNIFASCSDDRTVRVWELR